MKKVQFMNREEVIAELTEHNIKFDSEHETRVLKKALEQAREVIEKEQTPVDGIAPSDEQNGVSEPPEEPEGEDTPTTEEEGPEGTLLRWVGGYGSYRMGKYKVTDEDPFVVVEDLKDIEYLKTVGFVEVPYEQLEAYYS